MSTFDSGLFFRKVILALSAITLFFLVLGFVFMANQIILLVFSAVLFAIVLTSAAGLFRRYLPVSRTFSIVLVIIILFIIIGIAGRLIAPSIVQQAEELRQTLPEAVERLTETLRDFQVGRLMLLHAPNLNRLGDFEFITNIAAFFTDTLTQLLYLFVVLVLGLYLAFNPHFYVDNGLKLFSPQHRNKAKIILLTIKDKLQIWLLTRLATMTFVGVMTTIGLTVLGIPLALLLGILAFFLDFIPNIGAVLAAIPAVLLGLVDSPITALYVILVYVVVQSLESYLVTPLLEQHALSLPPAFMIPVQLVLGIILGFLGLVLATPLTIVFLVLINTLYVKNMSGEKPRRKNKCSKS
jgi:predicted PurR-regulated permease PerM